MIPINERHLLPKYLDNSKKNKGKINRFKRSCLKNKTTIYQDHVLRVGAKTLNFIDNNTGDVYLKIEMFYKNMSNDVVGNFSVEVKTD